MVKVGLWSLLFCLTWVVSTVFSITGCTGVPDRTESSPEDYRIFTPKAGVGRIFFFYSDSIHGLAGFFPRYDSFRLEVDDMDVGSITGSGEYIVIDIPPGIHHFNVPLPECNSCSNNYRYLSMYVKLGNVYYVHLSYFQGTYESFPRYWFFSEKEDFSQKLISKRTKAYSEVDFTMLQRSAKINATGDLPASLYDELISSEFPSPSPRDNSLPHESPIPRSSNTTAQPPTISVKSPTIETTTQTVPISGVINAGGRIISLAVDGSNAPFQSDGLFSFSRVVPVGSSVIHMTVTDEWGQIGVTSIKVVRSIPSTSATGFEPLNPSRSMGKLNPNAIALIIGVDQYENAPPAEFAENDARSFYDYATNALGVPPDRVRLMTGRDARVLDVQRAVRNWLRPLVVRNQTDVYIFFAGHGLASEDGTDLFLLPYDGDRTLLDRSAIRRKELIDVINASGAASATMFLDTCYSGGTRGTDSLVSARPVLIVAKEQQIPANVTIFAAAGNDQLSSVLASAKHGLFSYFLMKGLEGNAAGADHTITAARMEAYLAARIPPEAAKLGRNQTPHLLGDGSRVISTW